MGKLKSSARRGLPRQNQSETGPTYQINLAGNHNSCLIKIQKQKLRALVDSGAQVSLLHESVIKELKKRTNIKVESTKINLQTANGELMQVLGSTLIDFEIGNMKINHRFIIVKELNRKVILGRDWLTQNGVRLYFDLGSLRIGKSYVPLEEDIHISLIVRSVSNIKIKPNHSMLLSGKIKSQVMKNQLYEVNALTDGFISQEPGIQIINSIVQTNDTRVPILIVNNTNKMYAIKRGCALGKLDKISEESIVDTRPPLSDNKPGQTKNINWDDVKVPPKYKDKIVELLKANSDLFALSDLDLGHTSTVKMKIDTADHPPIRSKPYRIPLLKRQVVDSAIDEMLKAGIIQRSRSPWSFPLLVVEKKDSSQRLVIDFRKLNKITKPISYPLPLIDDILALLGGSVFYSSLDLKSGFWQVLLDEKDREKASFCSHRGLFSFNRMPFGLTGAPGVFQQLMSIVLEGLEKFSLCYLDDILIFSPSLEQHLEHIQIVLDRLRTHNLKMKLSKCQFLAEETKYLGFVINEQGVKPDIEKVQAIRGLEPPQTVREVRSYLGMLSFYRRFLPQFSEIAQPLVALTKKHARFKWDENCQTAFEVLKQELTRVPLLSFPDPNKPYILYTDSSDTCIGACLVQETDEPVEIIPGVKNEKPVYFLSHKLSDTQCRYSILEKECFAIYYALQKLDAYLHGAKFTIKCDHLPLKYLLDSPMQNRKVQLWALSIAGYDCTIEYVRGTDNCSDLLSRARTTGLDNPSDNKDIQLDLDDRTFQINAINSNQIDPNDYAGIDPPVQEDQSDIEIETPSSIDMKLEQDKDEKITKLKEKIKNGEIIKGMPNLLLRKDGVLCYITDPDDEPIVRLYVPTHLKDDIIQQYHDENGHMGIDKTYLTIKTKYFWPKMYKDLYAKIENCITCQERNLKRIKPPIQSTDIPPYPFAKVGFDLSGPYPRTLSGNVYILSFIDWYSGWIEAFPIANKMAETVAQIIIDEIFPRYGAPLQMVSDNGSEAVNEIMQQTLSKLNISHVKTSFYNPLGNAQVERSHRTLHDVISKLVKDDLQTWDLHLNQALAAIRFNVGDSRKFSPFFLLYNREVVLPIDNLLKPHKKYLGEQHHLIALQNQHKVFMMVYKRLKKGKDRQAKYANQGTKLVDLEIGDKVFYKNHNKKGKLDRKWVPYYIVTEKKTPVSFVIRSQLTGATTKAHLQHLRKANIDEWEIPKDKDGKILRRARYVVDPEESSEDDSESEIDTRPLVKMAARKVNERQNSSDEDDIPLAELKRRLRQNEAMTKPPEATLKDPEANIQSDAILDKTELSEASGSSSSHNIDHSSDNDTDENQSMDTDVQSPQDTDNMSVNKINVKEKQSETELKIKGFQTLCDSLLNAFNKI